MFRVGLLTIACLQLAAAASGQTPGALTSAVTGAAAQRLTSLPQLAAIPAAVATELTVQWDGADSSGAAPAGAAVASVFEIVASRVVADSPVAERAPQLSEDRLVVVGADAQGREVGWQIVPDPGVVRSEQPGPGGVLTGQVLRRPRVTFLLMVPRGAVSIVELRLYRPRWTGTAFTLDSVGTLSIPPDAR